MSHGLNTAITISRAKHGVYASFDNNSYSFNHFRYKINAFKALTSWIQIGAVTLDNIDKNEVMHEAFSTLGNIQESPTVYESAADCVIALLIRLEDQDNSAYINHLGVLIFTTVCRNKTENFQSKKARQ